MSILVAAPILVGLDRPCILPSTMSVATEDAVSVSSSRGLLFKKLFHVSELPFRGHQFSGKL